MRKIYIIFFASLLILFNGCASLSNSNINEIRNFDTLIINNNCNYKSIDKKIKNSDDIILWSVQGGSLARNCGDFLRSINYFDTAEYHYKYDVDLSNMLTTTIRKTKSIFLNNNANDYEGYIYEKIMLNTYNALNFLALNDFSNARVEFNRALERQSFAKEYFQNEINKEIEKLKKQDEDLLYKQNNSQKQSYIKNTDYSYLSKLPMEKSGYSYPDFVNPFTTYMSALFFLLDGSYEMSFNLFRENLQMDPKNPQIAKDLLLANNLANSAKTIETSQKYVWLIYENGFSPAKIETRIDLPLFIASDSLYYTGIALPKLQLRQSSYRYLVIKNDFGNYEKTSLIADMDSIVIAEFNKRYKIIAAEAIISTTAKTVFQKQMNDIHEWFGIFASIFQAYSTRADLRNWSALPKNFQAASIPIKDGDITILNENGVVLLKENLPKNKNTIIYIRSSHVGQIIAHKIIF